MFYVRFIELSQPKNLKGMNGIWDPPILKTLTGLLWLHSCVLGSHVKARGRQNQLILVSPKQKNLPSDGSNPTTLSASSRNRLKDCEEAAGTWHLRQGLLHRLRQALVVYALGEKNDTYLKGKKKGSPFLDEKTGKRVFMSGSNNFQIVGNMKSSSAGGLLLLVLSALLLLLHMGFLSLNGLFFQW